MLQSKLFVHLPEWINTPDGMDIDKDGNLIVSCPNFADPSTTGVVIKIMKDTREVVKWFDVPVHPETGVARNMGIAINHIKDDIYDIFLCDNQGWSGAAELMFKGRMLKVRMDGDKMVGHTVMATDMEHPNGVKYKDGYIYLTQSLLTKIESDKIMSCVYRFHEDDENIKVNNLLNDPNMITTIKTQHPEVQYGADGISFDKEGNLYISNFGDAAIHKITFNADQTVADNVIWAQNQDECQSIDGIAFDDQGYLYMADFSQNAIVRVSPDGKTVKRLAQSPDKSGFDGGLEQPGEPIVYGDKIVATCFDLVTGPDKINTGHEMPATLAYLDMDFDW